MLYDRLLTISTAGTRKATQWPASTLRWSEFIDRLRVPVRGTETVAEYLSLGVGEQSALKDVGGFVGGGLEDNRRKAGRVLGRDLLTLDIDNIPAGETETVLRSLEALGCAYAVYSTRKHRPDNPRLRVIWAPDRTVLPDEYEPLLRKLAQLAGFLPLCDPTTFEAHRLMYWPSCCADGEYVFHCADKAFVSVDGVLAMYPDWRDVSAWPPVPGAVPHKVLATRQGDPTTKDGLVGAFCRVYDVPAAMDALLPGIYEPTDTPGRYTYADGSTVGGAILYDNGLFLYSHHATDPCGGKLVNAFDLVRLHKFAERDIEAVDGTPVNRLPSYAAMRELAVADPEVTTLLNKERYERATEIFEKPVEENLTDWMRLLAVAPSTGAIQKTTDNAVVILLYDPLLRGKLALDDFSGRGMALGALPWNPEQKRRWWSDHDDAGLRHYLEKTYGVTGKDRIADACVLVAQKNVYDDVREYLQGLVWDGTPRLDTLFVDYLGAVDGNYTRAVTRKCFVAAVARALTPGCKYDYTPILTGPQGVGKSTLIRKMGLRWFSDSLEVFYGKEAAEMLRGVWINELGELSGLNRAEVETVKSFLTRTSDIYREPFGRRTSQFPRRCVFFGTSNSDSFLRDMTGNRRFWPVDVGLSPPTKSVFRDLEGKIDKLWAEAVSRFKDGEKLFLSPEIEAEAAEIQEGHREVSGREGIILEFIERPVPLDWEKWDAGRRRMYWSDWHRQSLETRPRDRICAVEVWCEALGGDIKQVKYAESKEINAVIARAPGWKRRAQATRYGFYGIARGGFERCNIAPVTTGIT